MTANRSRSYVIGACVCKVGLILIGFGFFVQVLNNFFYRQPFDRLFGLGGAFILTFALLRTFRIMERKGARLARSSASRVLYDDPRERLPAATYPHHVR
jgi:hypothetical protein